MALPVMTIDGDVVAVHSHWTDDGSRIVTEATVHTSDGQDVVVSQLGGSAGGLGMIQFPGPEVLVLGMHVAVAAHKDVDLSQREHVVLDSAKVLAYPPGFVRTGPTKAGHYLYWESGCVFVTIDAAGTTAITGDAEFPIIDASIATWNDATDSCSYLKVMSNGRKSLEVGNDKVNLIKFRDTTWGRPAVGNDPARTYSSFAAGITTVVYVDDPSNARDGAIVDADVELNGVNFAISVDGQTNNRNGDLADLANTLTHELGHLHGLEHTCYINGDPQEVDNQGKPVLSCSSPLLPAEVRETTMYPTQSPGETKKATLAPDDINAMCAIYPTAKDPGTCEAVGQTGGGCCSASPEGSGASFLLAGGTLLVVMRRRKRAQGA